MGQEKVGSVLFQLFCIIPVSAFYSFEAVESHSKINSVTEALRNELFFPYIF